MRQEIEPHDKRFGLADLPQDEPGAAGTALDEEDARIAATQVYRQAYLASHGLSGTVDADIPLDTTIIDEVERHASTIVRASDPERSESIPPEDLDYLRSFLDLASMTDASYVASMFTKRACYVSSLLLANHFPLTITEMLDSIRDGLPMDDLMRETLDMPNPRRFWELMRQAIPPKE